MRNHQPCSPLPCATVAFLRSPWVSAFGSEVVQHREGLGLSNSGRRSDGHDEHRDRKKSQIRFFVIWSTSPVRSSFFCEPEL